VNTLEALRREVDPDRIVIETSGVALPYETQLQLYRPPVSDWVGDEAAVVVVDAERLLQDEDTGPTFEDQVTNADLLVLHKVDLVPADTLPGLHAKLTTLNPDAPVLEAVMGNVSPELLFPSGPRRGAGRACETVRPCDATHDHVHDHDHGPKDHHREHFESHELRVPDDLDSDAALAWIGARRGLRTKGFVRTTEGVRIVQGVGRRLELTEPGGLVVPEDLLGRVVVIVRAG
jgi:cobalamin biosynthesis protein CobW